MWILILVVVAGVFLGLMIGDLVLWISIKKIRTTKKATWDRVKEAYPLSSYFIIYKYMKTLKKFKNG